MSDTRSPRCLGKLKRLDKALRHEEGDRIPLSDFYWTTFLSRWRKELGLAADADIYRHYDLDWICITPNMDPHIRSFQVIKETEEDVVLKTGFEATIRKRHGTQMPYFEGFDTDDLQKMAGFRFDDADDERRFSKGGDDQLNGVGDVISRNIPAWKDRVKSYYKDFPVYGSICEGHEYLWRIIGTENVLLWLGLYPGEVEAFVRRIGEFLLKMTKEQIKAGGGMLAGMVIWGDVAYRKGMLFSPAMWREHFKPIVAEQIRICHDAGIPAIYHGCGNASDIFGDFIEMGLDAYNPLEAKAGLDVVALRKKLGHTMGFCGNIDVLAWANDPLPELEAQVMRKLNAAKGGGYLLQSDHSVPSNVSVERYEFVLDLARKHGSYPLDLGAWDDPSIPGGKDAK
jgi:uroporphyrinogen decarboxylase